MCGIAGGSWATGGEPVSEEIVQRMTSVISHRGPDDSGLQVSAATGSDSAAGAVLGQRRLSIIDLAGGHQPLSNEDGTVWITFNGEIYNYKELREKLVARGHRFQTDCDTEVIVHLYEDLGTDCVAELRGMFAFAIWDENEQRLFLARDRVGQKPLFYRLTGKRLFFASELKSLLQVPEAPREIDPHALDDYLTYQYVPHPQCILQGYRKLPPAHHASFQRGLLTVTRYWEPGYWNVDETAQRTKEEWQELLRETLTEAVRLRMRSDVPLGAFLSGGIDSTIITGLMQSLSNRPVHTFSIGFPVKKFDERHYAQMAAKHLGTDHHEQIVEPSGLEMLPRLIWHYDEPFSDSSAIPTMALSEMTRQHVKVALSGDGGDELFAGYERYRAVQLGQKFDRLPKLIKKMITAKLWQKIPSSIEQKSKRRRLKRFLSALGEPPEERYLKWIAIFDQQRRRELYSHEFLKQLGNHQALTFLRDAYNECPSRDFVTRTTCADVLTYLPCDILTKVDIASMSASLEARSPLLDHHVVELAARMPIELKIKGKTQKAILSETFADLIPEPIRTRPKMGFGVPLDHWFRNELKPLIQETLLDPSCLGRGYFNPAGVEQLVNEHLNGQWDHSYRLWSLLCLEMWHRTFLDPATPPSEPVLHSAVG